LEVESPALGFLPANPLADKRAFPDFRTAAAETIALRSRLDLPGYPLGLSALDFAEWLGGEDETRALVAVKYFRMLFENLFEEFDRLKAAAPERQNGAAGDPVVVLSDRFDGDAGLRWRELLSAVIESAMRRRGSRYGPLLLQKVEAYDAAGGAWR